MGDEGRPQNRQRNRVDNRHCRLGGPELRLDALLVDDGVGASGSGLQQFGLMDDEIKDGEGRTPRIPGKGQGKIW